MQEFDKETVRRVDSVAEVEIALGFRVKQVPAHIREALTAEEIDAPTAIRLSRVNPFRRAAINEAVQRRYQADLKNATVLSNAQVLKLVEERGEWSAALQKEMEDLQEATTREMGRLWADGLTPDTASFADDIIKEHARFHDLCKDIEPARRADLLERFDRWVSWSDARKDDSRFQGYDVGTEYAMLYEQAPVDAIEVLSDLTALKEKQERLRTLNEQRVRLAELQLKHARIFSDTAESRRDHTEQIAQVYWTCERADEAGRPIGRLTPDFDALWNWPDAAIQWLLYEAFFFHNNIPDVARDYLGAFGFFMAERGPTESGKSAASPAPPNSKTDGEPSAKTPAASSEPTPATA